MKGQLAIKLKYGTEFLTVVIPKARVMDVLEPEDLPGVVQPLEEVRRSLLNPIGSKSLSELSRDKKNVMIICSDITRPAPSHLLVPPILKELNKAGVRDEQITIVFALGYHRSHTEEEQKKLVGEAVFQRVKCIDHDRNNCHNLGKSSRGTPIDVFEPITKADLIIATGNLEFHFFAGYSGGDKALMPGICSQETVEANHAMLFESSARSGIIDGNPIREDIEEIGRRAGVAFIVNAVLNSKNEIVVCVAGDPIKAHREGCKYIDCMNKRTIPYRADIVICSAGGYPKDISLYQAQKALENASYSVKEGGIIILVARCQELLGEPTFDEWMRSAKNIDDPLKRIQTKFVLGAHKAAVICRVLKRNKGYLISDMPDELVEKCFFTPAKSVEEALEKAMEEMGPEVKVLIMPFANSTVPHVG